MIPAHPPLHPAYPHCTPIHGVCLFNEFQRVSRRAKKGDAATVAASDDKEAKRAQRSTSNVFAVFNQNQIQELKEVYPLPFQHSISPIISTSPL